MMSPQPDMTMFFIDGEETVQTTLAEMRDRAPMAPATQVWWPALGQEEGDSGELRWTTHGEAEAELGLTLPANHALAGATLQVKVLDHDLLSSDDLVASFPPLRLSSVAPGTATELWLEARSSSRPIKVADADVEAELVATARSAFEALDVNGNGLLEEAELSQLVETLARHEDEVLSTAKMMKILDTDGSGQIMYDHFEAWWLEQNKKKQR